MKPPIAWLQFLYFVPLQIFHYIHWFSDLQLSPTSTHIFLLSVHPLLSPAPSPQQHFFLCPFDYFSLPSGVLFPIYSQNIQTSMQIQNFVLKHYKVFLNYLFVLRQGLLSLSTMLTLYSQGSTSPASQVLGLRPGLPHLSSLNYSVSSE